MVEWSAQTRVEGVRRMNEGIKQEVEAFARSLAIEGDCKVSQGVTDKPLPCIISNKTGNSVTDSREQLEADVRNVMSQWYFETGWSGNTYHGLEERVVMQWLDRQAAITMRECERICDTCELSDSVAYAALQEELERCENAMNRAAGKWAMADAECRELRAKVEELTRALAAEREMSDGGGEKLAAIIEERERYRDLLGRMFDLIDDAAMLRRF